MPERTSVGIAFRVVREDGLQELLTAGDLHRMATGWALTCPMPEPAEAGEEPASEGFMTLIIRDNEIRMTRKGAVGQEQIFRIGEWRAGILRTAYNTWNAEAYTHRVLLKLEAAGGVVEWEYDLRMGDQELGRSVITLDIREEDSQ
jgi:uncharacterized beta-barrel protein YwiB (DUF1934 family)